jgi:hypothetical protein
MLEYTSLIAYLIGIVIWFFELKKYDGKVSVRLIIASILWPICFIVSMAIALVGCKNEV